MAEFALDKNQGVADGEPGCGSSVPERVKWHVADARVRQRGLVPFVHRLAVRRHRFGSPRVAASPRLGAEEDPAAVVEAVGESLDMQCPATSVRDAAQSGRRETAFPS
jgi:hypothetical protein